MVAPVSSGRRSTWEAPRRSAPSAAKGYLDWKLEDGPGGPWSAVRGFLLAQGPGLRAARGWPSDSLQLRVLLLQSSQRLGVRLFRQEAWRPVRPGLVVKFPADERSFRAGTATCPLPVLA
ncbi:hypothetical protein ACGFY9_24360 [Streptomyces sp. NPDC048504]|uniref:hypothetical protein n=1 Tax=Streptomyces sp. NPDC048504 TaxID=3365559 RepID=UPI00371DD031